MTDTDTRGRSGQDPQKQSRREGIPLGRIAGIPVILAYSWFIIAAFTVIAFGPVRPRRNGRPGDAVKLSNWVWPPQRLRTIFSLGQR